MGNPYYDPSYNPYPPPVLIGTGILFIIVPVAAALLRFYVRMHTAARLGIDDWLAIPAVVICVGVATAQIIAATAAGLGGHQPLDEHGKPGHTPQLYIYEKTRYTGEVAGAAGLCFIKLSVLFFFRRIFRVRAFIIVNNIVISLTAIWGISFVFVIAFQCSPPSTFWESLEIEYGNRCTTDLPAYLAFTFTDLALDVIIFVLPLPHLWLLRLPMRQKLGVALIFLLGSLIIAINITRTIIFTWFSDFVIHEQALLTSDVTWYASGPIFWHVAENAVGVLCACMPSFAPLFKGKLGRVKSRSPGASDLTGNPYYHRMGPPLPPYSEYIEDETLLHRGGL
ncbi:hypothetical protein CIB48_g6979 [Xylaria polymorpha]|nr:hypothetical protein CIB48_g6979 [Xylaria polymorpha]